MRRVRIHAAGKGAGAGDQAERLPEAAAVGCCPDASSLRLCCVPEEAEAVAVAVGGERSTCEPGKRKASQGRQACRFARLPLAAALPHHGSLQSLLSSVRRVRRQRWQAERQSLGQPFVALF
jgi:hypothetical protein